MIVPGEDDDHNLPEGTLYDYRKDFATFGYYRWRQGQIHRLHPHFKQILHRDVKTLNIFIKEGVLKLGDFGISKALENEEDMAQTKCGTPYFMPPEVCKNFPYDAKADVWAMGVIIYELITLKKPFDCQNIRGLFDKIKNAPLDPLPNGT